MLSLPNVPFPSAQRRFWPGTQLKPSACVVEISLQLYRKYNATALVAALRDLSRRHEPLRTIFPEVRGTPCVTVLETSEIDLSLEDISSTVPSADFLSVVGNLVRGPMDLRSTPPLLPFVSDLGSRGFVLLLAINHIAIDAWSLPWLVDDFLRAYYAQAQSTTPRIPPLSMQYSDWLIWNRRRLGKDDRAGIYSRQLEYWKHKLGHWRKESLIAEVQPSSDLLVQPEVVSLKFDEQLHRRLLALSRDRSADLFTVLHAGIVLLLSDSGEDDTLVATVVCGRSHPGVRRAVGLFENVIVLLVSTLGNPSFRELLNRTRQADSESFARSDLPFADLSEELAKEIGIAEQKLLQTMMVLQSTCETTGTTNACYTTITPGSSLRGRYDTLFTFTEIRKPNGFPAGIDCVLEFNRFRVSPDDASDRLRALETLLEYFSWHADESIDAVTRIIGDRKPDETVRASQPLSLSWRRLPALTADLPHHFIAPQNILQDQLASIFEDILAVNPVGVWDDFFSMGGDLSLCDELKRRTELVSGIRLPTTALSSGVTVHRLAELVLAERPCIRYMEIQPGNLRFKIPVILLHGDIAGGGIYARELARGLGADRPVFVLEQHGLNGQEVPLTIGQMAEDHLRTLSSFLPHGPYHLAGLCNGAVIAHEIANRLRDAGEHVGSLIAIDLPPKRNRGNYVRSRACRVPPAEAIHSADIRGAWLFSLYVEAFESHTPRQYPGELHVLWSRDGAERSGRNLVKDVEGYASEIIVYTIPGNHVSCVGRYVGECASKMALCLTDH